MKLVPTFTSYIAGIPCGILVNHHEVIQPWSGTVSTCPSDLDYYGYTEFDFTVLDRKGYYADWLTKKLTDEDEKRILNEYEALLRS